MISYALRLSYPTKRPVGNFTQLSTFRNSVIGGIGGGEGWEHASHGMHDPCMVYLHTFTIKINQNVAKSKVPYTWNIHGSYAIMHLIRGTSSFLVVALMGSLKHMGVMEVHWVWEIVGTKLLPSLKLTFSHLKMDVWNTRFLLGWAIFRCTLLVSGRVNTKFQKFWVYGIMMTVKRRKQIPAPSKGSLFKP